MGRSKKFINYGKANSKPVNSAGTIQLIGFPKVSMVVSKAKTNRSVEVAL